MLLALLTVSFTVKMTVVIHIFTDFSHTSYIYTSLAHISDRLNPSYTAPPATSLMMLSFVLIAGASPPLPKLTISSVSQHG